MDSPAQPVPGRPPGAKAELSLKLPRHVACPPAPTAPDFARSPGDIGPMVYRIEERLRATAGMALTDRQQAGIADITYRQSAMAQKLQAEIREGQAAARREIMGMLTGPQQAALADRCRGVEATESRARNLTL